MQTIRELYQLALNEAFRGETILLTVTKSPSQTENGYKAIFQGRDLLACLPATSRDFWLGLDFPGTVACTVRKFDKDLTIFAEPIRGESRLIICGGGHVSLPLAKVGAMLGFDVTVIDDRAAFANNTRFPEAEVICAGFQEALEDIGGENCYFAIVTRGHQHDTDCLRLILNRPYTYIGMMGSKARVELVKAQLAAAGLAKEKLDSIHAPIGLPIGAQTPEELAVSIFAEIIKEKTGRKTTIDKEVKVALNITADFPQALLTIISRQGSAPREIGTKMIVQADGTCFGTIGGGCLESEARSRALQAFDSGQGSIFTYDMTGAEAADEGMVCGGKVEVLIELLD